MRAFDGPCPPPRSTQPQSSRVTHRHSLPASQPAADPAPHPVQLPRSRLPRLTVRLVVAAAAGTEAAAAAAARSAPAARRAASSAARLHSRPRRPFAEGLLHTASLLFWVRK